MARWTENKIILSAGQAAGTATVLAAESIVPGNRKSVIIGNPGATACNLHLASGGTTGTGMPLAAASRMTLDATMPGFDGDLYVTGLAAGDKLSIWVA